MNKILTELGYIEIGAVTPGDKVIAFDPDTGALQHNVIEKVEWISKQAYQDCNAPQGYNDGEEPPTLKPEDVPFEFYVINGKWKLFQDQSIWYERAGHVNVYHARDIQIGDRLFNETDAPVAVSSVVRADGPGWWRFAISGDHSYVVDGLTLHNASRFWKGGGSANTWAAITSTNWSATSGGANNASVPGTSDVAIFDSNSGTSNSVIGASITVQGLECDGNALGTGTYGGTLTHNTGVTLTLNTGAASTFRLTSGMTYTPATTSSLVTVTHTTGTASIKCAGKSLFAFTMNGSGGTTQPVDTLLVNAGTNAALTITAGTLDCFTNTAAITTCLYQDTGTATRAVSWGGTVTVGGTAGVTTSVMNWASLTGMTFTKNSAGIVVLPPASAHAGYSISVPTNLTINALTLNAATTPYLLGMVAQGITGTTLTIGAGVSTAWTTGSGTYTWTSVISNGTSLLPTEVASQGQIIANIAASSTGRLNWCNVRNINFSGGATWTAKNSLNNGQNTGITITSPGYGPTTEALPQRAFKAGATSQSIDVFIQDGSSIGGDGLTGLVYNASGLTAYYRKGPTGTSTAITLATQTVAGAYSSGGFVEIDATNMPGMYRLDLPDTVIASTPNATLYLQGAANMVPCISELEIVSYDPTSATNLGLSALPTANPASNGGLPTVDATNSVAITSNIKKNTAKTGFMFMMTDSTNHAPAAGLTVTATRSIDGAAFASTTNSPTAVASGVYKIDLSAADMNGDHVMLRFTATAADDLNIEIVTQP